MSRSEFGNESMWTHAPKVYGTLTSFPHGGTHATLLSSSSIIHMVSFALGFLVGITQTASANSARNAGYVYQTPSYNCTHADVELHYSIPYNSGFMAGWTTSKMFNSTPCGTNWSNTKSNWERCMPGPPGAKAAGLREQRPLKRPAPWAVASA